MRILSTAEAGGWGRGGEGKACRTMAVELSTGGDTYAGAPSRKVFLHAYERYCITCREAREERGGEEGHLSLDLPGFLYFDFDVSF